jgi:hypothetical protein
MGDIMALRPNSITRPLVVTLALGLALLCAPTTASAMTTHDIGSDSITCDRGGELYRITGSSSSNTIYVCKGSAESPVMVDLAGVDMRFMDVEHDGKSTEASPLTIESGAYAIVYIGRDDPGVVDTLYGGNEHGSGKNWGYAGICVGNGAHVTIAGRGTLNVHGGGNEFGGAGIGGNYNQSVTDLTIDGGMTINATGAYSAPGIGSGRDGQLWGLVIKNGTINATGGKYAPGIGAGDAVGDGDGGTTHDVTIAGGTVTASGGEHAAGIGGSEGGPCERISITGGTVTASGGEHAAGVGGGEGGSCEKISITGGTVTASGGEHAAGVGGGEGALCKKVSITGGSVTATGGYGAAGVGGGRDARMDSISITGGGVTATGGMYAAGIGGGDLVGTGEGGTTGSIQIGGSATVGATGGGEAAGIGGSEGGKVDSISIASGTVRAWGGSNGAGIGCGDGADVSKLLISGGSIEAHGGDEGAGIGDANGGIAKVSVKQASGASLDIEAYGGDDGAGIGGGGGITGDIDIRIAGGEIMARGGKGAAGIGGTKQLLLTSGDAGTISIHGSGSIDAMGGEEGCGIGGGEHSMCHGIVIVGDGRDSLTVTAAARDSQGNWAAGIGSGRAECGDISLSHATIRASSSYEGSGIGTGAYHSGMTGAIKNITIDDCDVTCTMRNSTAAGIGSGYGGSVDNISISNSTYSGGNIGGSGCPSNGLVWFLDTQNDVKSISISDSTIDAQAPACTYANQRVPIAGIGTGVWGSMGSISITRSNVIRAAGAGGGAGIGSGGWYMVGKLSELQEYRGGKCDSIEISDSTVTATGSEGGAGIGGGFDTTAKKIRITGSTVNASGVGEADGGAGIGGGRAASVDDLLIDSSTVEAHGGSLAAGIGSGGGKNFVTDSFDTGTGRLAIQNGSTVKSWGGELGAGIGTGQGGQTSSNSDKGIVISDSAVEAHGGTDAAGIGGGANGKGGRGADLDRLSVSGKCRIDATGGDKGAGIGGGMDGAARNISIDLPTTADNAWYVRATGGSGAAGIGAGSIEEATGTLGAANPGHDLEHISISGGYVVATGGDSTLGAGAGIGGGSHYGTLDGLTITGGRIEAYRGVDYAGQSDAVDIGHGGLGEMGQKPLDRDDSFKVSGGTVLASTWGLDDPQITGGSVSARLGEAENGKVHVYQTTVTLPPSTQANAKVDALSTTIAYGTADIYSDGARKVYLYLPESAEMQQWADMRAGGSSYHEYGTTNTSGTGVLKTDGTLAFKVPEHPLAAGGSTTLVLDDAAYEGQAFEFAVSKGADVATIDGEATASSPGASVVVSGTGFGDYEVTATSNVQSDAFWSLTATYAAKVTMAMGAISITGNPTKAYDGVPVDDPAVTKNGDGAVTYAYYDASGHVLDGAPSAVGTYSVTATMAASEHYTQATSEPRSFSIVKASVSLGISAARQDAKATITATVMGMVNAEGSVRFEISGPAMLEPVKREATVEKDSNGNYVATTSFDYPSARVGEYRVTATFGETASYESASAKAAYDVNEEARSISVPTEYTRQYGDPSFTLQPTTDHPGAEDLWTYEVAYDQYPNIGNAVVVDRETGKVDILYAGRTTIKITLLDANAHYDEAVTYVTVTVSRMPITVTAYATTLSGSRVLDSVTYGNTASLSYHLEYDEKVGISHDITNGHGTLEPVPLDKTSAASDTPYPIAVRQVGADFKIGDTTYHDVFFCRNYLIEYKSIPVKVTPADLTVTADDVRGTWGAEPSYTYHFGNDSHKSNNLMSWDDPAKVFASLPQASLGGLSYAQLEPGTYKDAVKVTSGTIGTPANYVVTETVPGDLTVAAAPSSVAVSALSKTYDGGPATVTASSADGYERDGGAVTLAYRRLGSDGTSTDLGDVAPTGVGDYQVTANAPATAHFEASVAQASYSITQASPDLTLAATSKPYDGHPAEVSQGTATGYDGSVELSYYSSPSSGSTSGGTKLAEAPVEPGTYYVVASAQGSKSGNYADAEATCAFDIEKIDPALSLERRVQGL